MYCQLYSIDLLLSRVSHHSRPFVRFLAYLDLSSFSYSEPSQQAPYLVLALGQSILGPSSFYRASFSAVYLLWFISTHEQEWKKWEQP